jgi:sugar phosphate isomerase/epimerase
MPIDTLAAKAAEWGYQGVELCCWGDHLDVQRASTDDAYLAGRIDLLSRYDLHVPVVSNHKVGQVICDVIDARHQSLVPEHVWGDGQPSGVLERAVQEMINTFRVAEKIGAGVVSGFTGSNVWSYVVGYPAAKPGQIAEALKQFVWKWTPILDVARDLGLRFAYEVHPGQLAYDLYSAEAVLDALGDREEFGFTFDSSHLLWQGVEPVEFLRRFGNRIYHVHIKDATLALNGRTGVLSGYWPSGDARRGFQFRSPGRGTIDWDAIIRTLNEIGYDGPLSVDWHDAGLDRDFGASEACQFLKRIDFDPPIRRGKH